MRLVWISTTLRILLGVASLVMAGWFGFAHRSPWIVTILAAAFTILYIAGKWYVWRPILKTGSSATLGKAVLSTFVGQAVLAGLVYLVGLGLGRLFTTQSVSIGLSSTDFVIVWLVTTFGILASMVTGRIEAGTGPGDLMSKELLSQIDDISTRDRSIADHNDVKKGDFVVLPDPVTFQNVFSDYRGSNDYTQRALLHGTDYNGKKPVRELFAANDEAIAAAEARIEFQLPDTLRQLYKVKDGGMVSDIMVATSANPKPVYKDWRSAFGGYEIMYSLGSLRTVHDSILDFASKDDAEAFPDGAKQMLILAQYYQETTFLDYRSQGEPRVGIVDFDIEQWDEHVLWFENFTAFFSNLARVDPDPEFKRTPPRLTKKGPSTAHPDQFWIYGDTADHGADNALWDATEQRLSVDLPSALRPYLSAADGGQPYFNILPVFRSEQDNTVQLKPFMGDRLLGLDKWISLTELSNRLDFVFGVKPWSDIWDDSDQLIVISGSFDSVLMLDYRFEDEPTVLYASDLDDPQSAERLGPVTHFLGSLRAIRDPYANSAPIGDVRLSSRSSSSTTFWQPSRVSGVSAEDIQAHEARLDFDLPDRIKQWMQAQNGGKVRFRFLPPLKENANGYLNLDPTGTTWIDVFPDDIGAIETWQPLSKWLVEHQTDLGDALRQRESSTSYIKDEYGDPDSILVLATGPDRLTLLDQSRGGGGNFVLLVDVSEGWIETYRSGLVHGLGLAALRSELP